MTIRHSLITLPLLLALAFSGCVKKTAATVPVSAQGKVTVALATLAESNRAVVTTVMQLQAAGLLPVQTTRVILTYCDKIAVGDKGAILLVQSSDPWATRVTNVEALLNLLVPASSYLPSLGLNDAQLTQLSQLISADFAAITAAIQALK